MAFKEKPKIQLEDFTDMIDFEEKDSSTSSDITEIAFSQMQSFPNHKYKLYEGQRLQDMIESIKEYGIISPIILWHNENGDYIILSGHNRKNAGELAGLKKSPAVIKTDLTFEEAKLIVNETNLRQRSFTDLSHSERAYCLSEHYRTMKSQGKRNDILKDYSLNHCVTPPSEERLDPDDSQENATSSLIGTKLRTHEKIADNYALSKNTVARYIRIANLNESLMNLLDEEKIGFYAAYSLSFIEDENAQKIIAELLIRQGDKLDMKKADLMRYYFDKGKLSENMIYEILSGAKNKKAKSTARKPVKIKNTVIKRYFTANESPKEIEETIEKALAMYFEVIHSKNEAPGDDCKTTWT
ncbi:MAG: hypothetical protein ATN31_08490 [Candidatus Epulonipiscioides saccharophilum]|nr:MAG: hypothetical protein ATN31_08490 [Epulopiscium sp. AS2M-Bin001]